MKSQQKHELQENQVAKAVIKAPGFWDDSGSKYLAGAVVVLVIVVLIRYHLNSKRQSAAQAVQSLAMARTVINQLPRYAFVNPTVDARDVLAERRQSYNEANEYISDAMRLSEDRKIEAEALLSKGDLSWEIASLPPIPGSATQPSLQISDPKELLNTASQAYQTIITNYSDQRYAVIAARFGQAALDENHHDWNAAKAQYQAVSDQSQDMPAYAQLAKDRLNKLAEISRPVYLASAAPEPAAPKTPAENSIPPFLRAPTNGAAANATSNATTQATATHTSNASKTSPKKPSATKPH